MSSIVGKLPFDQLIEATIRPEGAEQRLREEVFDWLRNRYAMCACHHPAPPWFSMEDVAEQEVPGVTTTTVVNGEKVIRPEVLNGKLVTRLSKYIAVAWDYRMTSYDRTDLGNYVNMRRENIMGERIFDFTRNLNWNAGDFGDAGSCFWGGYTFSRLYTLPALKGFAMRFYNEARRGVGRCFILPRTRYLIVINGYSQGVGHPDSVTRDMAHFLGAWLNLKTRLVNVAVSNNMLYINSGRGYAVGDCRTEGIRMSVKSIGKCIDCGRDIDTPPALNHNLLFCGDCGQAQRNNLPF